MIIMECIDLRTCLQYDNEVSMYLAYNKGNTLRHVRVSDNREVAICCSKNSDVLFVIACPTKDICYAEKIHPDSDGNLDIYDFLKMFGLKSCPVSDKIWERGKAVKWKPKKMYLYDKGFSVLIDHKPIEYGSTET